MNISAQNGTQNLGGAIIQGIGGAGVTLDNISSLYTNQAGSAFIEDWAIDVSVVRRFNLEELTTISMAAAKKVKIGTLGLTVAQYGFESYSEQKIGLSYARLLTSYLSISGQFNILGFKIEDFDNSYKYTVEMGIYTRLSPKVHLAAHIYNPTSIKLTDEENLDSRMKLGVKYLPSLKVRLFSEIEKIIDRDLQIKFGSSYQVIENLDISLGANLSLESFHFGFQYRIQNAFTIAAAFSLNNSYLGNTPSFSGQYVSRTNQ